jgi:DNA repair exonuclease SbcCD ATPase subunit
MSIEDMGIATLVISAVGTVAAVIAAIAAMVAVRVARSVASSQESLQREIVNRQEVQQRKREALQACIDLRDLLDRWYRTLRENINPDLSPEQILANITELDTHWQFQHDYSTQISRISAAQESLCTPLLRKAQLFHDRSLRDKRRINERFTQNPRLQRPYHHYGRRQTNDEANKAYVEAVLQKLKDLYFGADDELERTIGQLSEQINQPLPIPLS